MSIPDVPATFRRREWLNDPESLLLSASPLRDLETAAGAAEFFGVGTSDLLMSRMCTVPLLPPELPRPVKGRFPAGVRAEALWHPLAWLPAGVRERRAVTDDENGDPGDRRQRDEYDDAYAIRVAVTIMGSALYDPVDGTWADVLSLAGIDLDREEDRKRVQDWLDGRDDHVLEGIDLTSFISPEAAETGQLLAVEENDLVLAGMHRAAWDLAGVLDGAVTPDTGDLTDGTDAQEASFALHLAALAGMYSFAPLGDPETETWRHDAAAARQADTPEALARVAKGMRDRIREISRETLEPFGAAVTMLTSLDAPDTAPETPGEPAGCPCG